MSNQLSFDFTGSFVQRHKKAVKIAAEATQPTLFSAWSPNIDVHLHSPQEAVATVSGPEPERAEHWLAGIVGSVRPLKSRRYAFPADKLDRLLFLRPPAHVTLDAATTAVARALWADALGVRPLKVVKSSGRLIAQSSRWPTGLGVRDAPWTAIAALVQAGVKLDVDSSAQVLLTRRLRESGATIATASLAGSAITISTSRPEMVERLGLPALAYDGGPNSGKFKLPLLASQSLLTQDLIKVPDELRQQIKKYTGPTKPLATGPDFPWTLYGFQAVDAGKALRILNTTGGVLLAGEMGSGKCLSVDTLVITPTGRVRASDVKLGDYLIGRNGRPTKVVGVYPQGEKDLYEVMFTDGFSALVDDEQLWCVNTPLRKDRGNAWMVKTTSALRSEPLRNNQGNLRWQIPMCEPVQFIQSQPLPIDPYVFGALLGDGSLAASGLSFTSADSFIVEELRRLLPDGTDIVLAPKTSRHKAQLAAERNVSVDLIGDYQYRIKDNGYLKNALASLGVLGQRAWEKHVPDSYLYSSEASRRALLQGLLDTDGGPLVRSGKTTSSSIEFSSTSEALTDAVVFLIQSLGGVARKSKPRNSSYTHKGEKKYGRSSWRVSAALPPGVQPFRVPRKAKKYVERVKYLPSRAIESIKPAGRGETVCFKVAAEDELFLLDHMVTVHNTTVSLSLVAELELWPLLVVAPLSAFSTWDRQLREMGKIPFLATSAPAASWASIESGEHDAVVISYDRLAAFAELIERMGFRSAIADEIQRVRSPGSRRSRSLRSLAAAIPFRIGLSGTPLVNGLADLLPIGAWIAPGEWKPRASDKELSDIYPGDPLESVADHLGSMMVRRRMEDAVSNMPKRNDHRVFIQLTVEQRKALHDLEEEARAAKESGDFDGPGSKIHAFAKLQQMRKIVNNPSAAGVPGPNPKIRAAVDLAEDFLSMGRKGVIFTADRTSFKQIGEELDALGIGWVGIWGSTPPEQRIENERRFHEDPNIKVVLCTIQAGSESWSASPTATWLICTSYVYAPATLDQMAARVHRLNSDPDGPEIEVMYIHAQAPDGTLDDRMLEILSVKRQMFSQVVDRQHFVDSTNVHYSMSDLLFLMTGEHDEKRAAAEKDAKEVQKKEQQRKLHAKRTLHKKKNQDLAADDGEWAMTLEQWAEQEDEAEDTTETEAFDADE